MEKSNIDSVGANYVIENDRTFSFDSENAETMTDLNKEYDPRRDTDTSNLVTPRGNSMTEFNRSLSFHEMKNLKFRKMYFAALAALINALCMGYGGTYTATALPNMEYENKTNLVPTTDEQGWIGSILAIGALIGGMTAGILADALGRKGALIFSTIPFLGGWSFIAFATSIPFLYCGRFIIGFCCGLVSVTAPMYLVEISTPEVRGLLGASFQLFVTVGILLVSCVGAVVVWWISAIIGGILSIITLIAMVFVPESPRWLMAKKKVEKAEEAVRWLQGDFLDASDLCASIQDDINNQPQGSISFGEFLFPEAYKPALLSFALMFFQQYSGVNAILFYTVSIFEKSKSSLVGTTATIIIAVVQLISTFFSSILMDRAGRKVLLLISGSIMALSYGIFGAFEYLSFRRGDYIRDTYGWLPVVCLVVFISAFSLGYGPIPWLMVSEITTARLRSIISGTATALNWTFVFAVTKSFHNMGEALYDFGVYWFYMTICIISCFFTMLVLPETKGKTLEEIQDNFKSKRSGSIVKVSKNSILTISDKV